MFQVLILVDFLGGYRVVLLMWVQFDVECYILLEFMVWEWDIIWIKVWLFVGFMEDLEEFGDYFIYDFGCESIIIIWMDEEVVLVFYNVC